MLSATGRRAVLGFAKPGPGLAKPQATPLAVSRRGIFSSVARFGGSHKPDPYGRKGVMGQSFLNCKQGNYPYSHRDSGGHVVYPGQAPYNAIRGVMGKNPWIGIMECHAHQATVYR